MAHITLVRHGQANTTARDEVSYDRLSELGHRQSRWLGAHFRDTGDRFARVYSGTLRRHRETAQGIAADVSEGIVEDPRLNEMEYFTMAQALQREHGIAIPQEREEFATHMPILLDYWQRGLIAGAPERFDAFETRVSDALSEIAEGTGRALVVTSGGLIGMAMRVTMGLGVPAMAQACLAIRNTSVHRWQQMPAGLALVQFNAIPHLEHPKRQFAQTHV